MAVTMVIGNRHEISASLFAPGYTMASLIANEFSEATSDMHLSALMAVGFVLLRGHADRERDRALAGLARRVGELRDEHGRRDRATARRPRPRSTRPRSASRDLSVVMIALTCLAAALAVVPLVVILGYLIKQGAGALSLDFFTHMPKPVGRERAAGWRTPSSAR